MVIISKNINLKKRLIIFLFWSLSFFIGNIVLDNFGIMETINFTQREYGNVIISRYNLGFTNPNMPMMKVIPILLIIYYLYGDKKNLKIGSIILGIAYIVFKFTYSRTGIIIAIILFCIILIKDKYLEKFKILIYSEILVILFFSFYLSIKFHNTKLDILLSKRLYYYNYYFQNVTLKLYEYKGNNTIIPNFPLDNNYLRILFGYGYVGLFLVIILTIIIFSILFKNKDYKAIRIFVVILIYGYMEGTVLFFDINIVYLILFQYLVKKGKNRRWICDKNKCNSASVQ